MILSDLGLTTDDDHVMPDGDIWTLDSAGVAVSLGGDGAFGDEEGRGGLPEHPVQSLEVVPVGQFHELAEL